MISLRVPKSDADGSQCLELNGTYYMLWDFGVGLGRNRTAPSSCLYILLRDSFKRLFFFFFFKVLPC